MNGYSCSKIKVVSTENSRSMDCSDLILLTSNPTRNSTVKNQEINNIVKNSNPNIQDSSEREDDQEGNNGEMFEPKLKGNSSVSSALALQTAVKRAFSMRRSSSVSERYYRIHDQSVTLASPFEDEELGTTRTRRSVKNKNSRGKIFKAWKKLFGL